jgi:NADH-quinone oxidoreductase subunit G
VRRQGIMPRLTIDNRIIEVAKGTKVIQAAEQLGIYIPRFCYHEALGSVGACRMCAVMFLDGPVKGLKMSCMTDVADGMVVSTDHPEAQEFRRYVIEWLMQNHPHDCPVCDEGGHCLLQDMTVSSGHGIRRYDGLKRTFHDQDLGPFLAHEMNRCIHCWRCRRFYQEYAGYRDLGALQIGRHTYFGRWHSGRLQSPFAGNLIDLCPTGVFTDKPSRFQGRYWDFERADSVCPHCSLGCATTANARYRQVVRLEARTDPAVNGHFICDRGRYGFAFANHTQRPRRARVDGAESEIRPALDQAADRLRNIAAEFGPGAVAALGSWRMSLEAQIALQRLSLERVWPGACFFPEPDLGSRVQAAVRGLDAELAVSPAQLEQADFILVVGVSPLTEAPMLALHLRQAWCGGAEVAVLDPRPLELPFPTKHLPLACGLLDIGLPWLIKQSFGAKQRKKLETAHAELLAPQWDEGLEKRELRELKKIARALARSQRPALICGTDLVPQELPAMAAGLVRILREQGKEAGLSFILPGANAFGAALVAPEEAAAGDLLEAIEQEEVRALLVVENDPIFNFPDRGRMERTLARLQLLVVLDHLPTPTAQLAHIFIPVTNLYESPGASLVNQEGRLQRANAACHAGQPLSQSHGGAHPPHTFPAAVAGGDPQPSADLLDQLARRLSSNGEGTSHISDWDWLAQRQAAVAAAVQDGRPVYGSLLLPKQAGECFSCERAIASPVPPHELELLVSPSLLCGEEMASYSQILAEAAGQAVLWLHPKTAEELGLTPEGRVKLELGEGILDLPLCISNDMHQRSAVLIPGMETPWQQIRGRREVLPITALQTGSEA